jgi:hypothetical protein
MSWLFGGPRASAPTRIAGDHNNVFNYIVQGGVTVPLPMRRTQWTPQLQDGAGVAALLGWQSRLVPLLGREAAMVELRAWRDDDRFPLSIKLVSAPGGAGKTRLAAEFSEDEDAAGWQHGWVSLRDFEGAESLAWQGRWLLIVDYPEHEPEGLERLARLLSRLSPSNGQWLRVLMLARKTEDVERALNEQRCGSFLAPILALPELPAPEGWALFSQALQYLASAIKVVAPGVTQPAFEAWQASDALHRSPLFVLAQAIYWMSETPAATAASHRWLKGGASLSALVAVERAAWRRAERGHSAPPGSVEATLAWATLCGGLTDAQINHHLAPAWGWNAAQVAALHQCLGALGCVVDAHRCAPLGPDLLAAQFVTEAWNQATWQGQAERDARLAEKLLALKDAVVFVPQLNRLHMLAYDQTVRLAACAPSDVQSVEGLLLSWAQRAPDLEAALGRGLSARVEWAAFARLGLVLAEKLFRTDGKDMPDEQRAGALNNLANRLSETGDRAGALASAQEAVTIYRRLAQVNPAAYELELATSLNNLAGFLSKTGDRSGAMAPAQEAVTICLRLAQVNPAAYETYLAGSLNNLAGFLSEVGDRKGALAPAQEAVNIYRLLSHVNPAVYEPDLAMSLNNLAGFLSDVGDRKGALAPAQEAVNIRWRLAQANPAAYEHDLAASLITLANRLSDIGDRQGALAPAQEAATLCRRLAQANPAAYEHVLGIGLNTLANCLSETGDRQGALAVSQEVVTIYRRLAQASPVAYEPNLAGNLNNLASRLRATGDCKGALAPAQEAVTLYRRLARSNSAAYEPDLARSLNALVAVSSEAGDKQGAVDSAKESLAIRRRLASANPAAYNPALAASLSNLANALTEARDYQGALAPAQEAVSVCRELLLVDQRTYAPILANSLWTLARCFAAAGHLESALPVGREALGMFTMLATQMPASFEAQRSDLAALMQIWQSR